jgi:hypothetical protein
MVEGARHPLTNQRDHAFQIFQSIAASDSQNAIAAIRHVTVSGFVALWPIAKIVSATIDLDHKPRCRNIEVSDVGPNRVLTANLESQLARAKLTPKEHFGWRHVPA